MSRQGAHDCWTAIIGGTCRRISGHSPRHRRHDLRPAPHRLRLGAVVPVNWRAPIQRSTPPRLTTGKLDSSSVFLGHSQMAGPICPRSPACRAHVAEINTFEHVSPPFCAAPVCRRGASGAPGASLFRRQGPPEHMPKTIKRGADGAVARVATFRPKIRVFGRVVGCAWQARSRRRLAGGICGVSVGEQELTVQFPSIAPLGSRRAGGLGLAKAWLILIRLSPITPSPTQRFMPSSPLYRLRLRPCRRLITLMRPSHPVRHFWPLRNQRFFCSGFGPGSYWSDWGSRRV